MGVLLERPDIHAFWATPDISVAYKNFKAKEPLPLIRGLGYIFKKHGLWQHFGLGLVHRHFDMTEKEVLVETLNQDHSMSIALPWTVQGDKASPSDPELWKTYDLKETTFISSQSWSFGRDGSLKAYEFMSHAEAPLPLPQTFVTELFNRLTELSLADQVGIIRLRKVVSKMSCEVTPEGIRANISYLKVVPSDICKDCMITVGWTFTEDGDLQDGWICGSCCGSCQTCIGHTKTTKNRH